MLRRGASCTHEHVLNTQSIQEYRQGCEVVRVLSKTPRRALTERYLPTLFLVYVMYMWFARTCFKVVKEQSKGAACAWVIKNRWKNAPRFWPHE